MSFEHAAAGFGGRDEAVGEPARAHRGDEIGDDPPPPEDQPPDDPLTYQMPECRRPPRPMLQNARKITSPTKSIQSSAPNTDGW